jgi:cholinesterase
MRSYRVSVFGFPGLPGTDQNIGLLDQRLAIEWIRTNIAAFGGDPNRITLFGNSAGGTSIDYYSYAWQSDPIVNGFIAQSGVATSFLNPAPPDNTQAWYTLTQALGCGDASTGVLVTLHCMRSKSMSDILSASAATAPFGPTADGRTVFPDYVSRGMSGRFIKKPMLLGNNDYEAGIIKVLFEAMGRTQSLLQWAVLNLKIFTCPVGSAAQYRASNGVPVWRYRYFGEFPNLRLTDHPSSGAWHGSEIATVFGTAEQAGLPNTQAEAAISRYIMGAWASFAKDPTTALSRPPYSWPLYSPQSIPVQSNTRREFYRLTNDAGNSLIRLAYDNQTSASFVAPVTYDYACPLVLAPGGPDMEALSKVTNLTELGGGAEIGY